MPYLEYLISTAEHKRLEHLAWVGTVLPVEHEWWDTHYPPNGWNCQCRVRQLSAHEAKTRPRYGDTPEDFGARDFANWRTGEVTRVPNGIDAGWNNNPGKFRMRTAADLLVGKIDQMDPEARRIAVADLTGSKLFEHIAKGGFDFDPKSNDPAMVGARRHRAARRGDPQEDRRAASRAPAWEKRRRRRQTVGSGGRRRTRQAGAVADRRDGHDRATIRARRPGHRGRA